MKKLLLSTLLLLASSLTMAAQDTDKNAKLKSFLAANLGINVQKINPAPIKGLLELITDKGLFYSSADGKYLIHGKIYNLQDGFTNETEKTLATMRKAGLIRFAPNSITYKAPHEKYRVAVYTDTTCPYCRKMHSQIDQYNALGITVEYLAFPRSGLNGKTFKSMESAWCADDPKTAMTREFERKPVPSKTCDSKIADQYNFAVSVGVNATPTTILADGKMVPGYQPPQQMLKMLQQLQAAESTN